MKDWITTLMHFMGSYRNSEFAYVLGAGASAEAGFPNWRTLVQKLCDNYGLRIEVDQSKVIEIVGALENKIADNYYDDNLFSTLPSELRENKRLLCRGQIRQDNADAVYSILLEQKHKFLPAQKTPLVDAIANICKTRSGQNLRTVVINYNYDDLFLYTLLKFDSDKSHVRVNDFTEGCRKLPSERDCECRIVDLYHVHGRLPVFTKNIMDLAESVEIQKCTQAGIILSSYDYFELAEDKFLSWTNQVQHAIYSSLPLIIIGFSLDDINFRLIIRKLQQAGMINKPIIIFMSYKEGDTVEETQNNEKMALSNCLLVAQLLNPFNRNPAVQLVSCPHKEVPEILEKLFTG